MSGEAEQIGGITRFSYGQAAAEAPPPVGPSCRVYGATTRVSVGEGGGTSEVGQTFHVVGQDNPVPTRVADSLKMVNGRATVCLVPGQEGSRTLVETAIRDGLIRKVGGGVYEDIGQQAAPAGAPAAAAVPPGGSDDGEGDGDTPAVSYFDPQDDADWAADSANIPPHAYDAAQASVTAQVLRGTGSFDESAKVLAGNAHIDPGLAKEMVTQAYLMYERVVDRAIEDLGITGDRRDAFYESLRGNQNRLHDAINRLTHQRDPSGFREMAIEYQRHNPPDLSAVHAAGFETHIEHDTGRVLVRKGQGAWVPLASMMR